jgi:ESAT-6 family protein
MDRLVINFAALHQAAIDINTAINAMESQLHDCESSAAPLISTWEGEAQASYQQRQAQWRQAAGDLSQMLREIKAAVEESASNFQQTESRNAAMFQ